jgi:chemotaxis response regulator CheB
LAFIIGFSSRPDMPTSRKKAERHQKGKASQNKVAEIRGSQKDSSRDAGTRVSFPIVAIGASAGGLEAFSNLLRALPEDPGLALVFIPHLRSTCKP